MTLIALALTRGVKAYARELGFDDVAVGPAGPPEHGWAFERWLDAGYAGSMTYLARTRAERLDPERLLPGARAVVAVAMSYRPEDDDRTATSDRGLRRGDALDSAPPPGGGGRDRMSRPGEIPADRDPSASRTTGGESRARVARYARGRDYHDVLKPRLLRLAEFIAQAAGPGVTSRAAVDTSAVLERDLAARAGLGWIGKNTNLLSEALGSYVFIGIVLTTAALEPDTRVPDRCGTCTACLDACPTGAFVAPWVLDARRCISYLTIEHRGAIDEALRPGLREWLFGCDVCQEVCPWNRKAPAGREPAFAPTTEVGEPGELLGLDDAGFRARFRGTALLRAKRSGLARNAALVLANHADPAQARALEGALADADPVVRDAARWALHRLGIRGTVKAGTDDGGHAG